MHVAFHCSGKSRCLAFARKFIHGVAMNGDSADMRSVYGPEFKTDMDVAVVMGVQQRATFDHFKRNGIPLLYIDKGYTRTWDWRRVAINAAQPTDYLGYGHASHFSDRAASFGWKPRPMRLPLRKDNEVTIIALSSKNYHTFMGLPPPDDCAVQIRDALDKLGQRYNLVYRPKPNQGTTLAVEGLWTSYRKTLRDDLRNAHALITYGSSSCLDALLMGVPSIILGDAIARPLSSTSLADLGSPRLASIAEQQVWLNDLAYCQWSLEEFGNGVAWAYLRQRFVDLTLRSI